MEKTELNEWQKEFLAQPESCSVRHRREGKSYAQAYDLMKFMKTAGIGKKIAIVGPEGHRVWERVE